MSDKKAYLISSLVVVSLALVLAPALETVFVLVVALWLAGIVWSTAQFILGLPAFVKFMVDYVESNMS